MGVLCRWSVAVGEDGFDQVVDYFVSVDEAADEERYFPLEVLTAGLFVPLLVPSTSDVINSIKSRRVTDAGSTSTRQSHGFAQTPGEQRGRDHAWPAPICCCLRILNKRVRRYVSAPFFDLVWRPDWPS
jgi:hypothetical protein